MTIPFSTNRKYPILVADVPPEDCGTCACNACDHQWEEPPGDVDMDMLRCPACGDFNVWWKYEWAA